MDSEKFIIIYQMQSEYFVLNKTPQTRGLRKSMLLAGSLVIVGTVAAVMILKSSEMRPKRELILYGDGQYSEHQVAFM